MALLEMHDTDLQELYVLLQLYSQTYNKHDITLADLQQDIERKCSDRGIPCIASNTRNAGRKRKYDNATRDNIINLYRNHDNLNLTLRQIASQTGVSYSTVQRIISDYRFKTHN